MDNSTILLFVVIAVVVFISALLKRRPGGSAGEYVIQDALFTAAERSFVGVLDLATAGRYRVFGKVRVADVITPAKGLDKKRWSTLFNKVTAKHFDFVLCDPETFDVRGVIELNDKSHGSRRRAERDAFLRKACEAAGLAFVEVTAKRSYLAEDVRELLLQLDGQPRNGELEAQTGRREPTL